MGPADLDQALCGLEIPFDANILAGVAGSEDAGVYRLSDELALVQTVDFFTPIVDDPRIFGRVAAANSLSDVYAMGGRPITAMNVVCFPSKKLGIAVLRGILEGGLDILKQAGVALVGGHSVDDDEPKYGLSVSGLIHPDRIMTNSGLKPGDRLVLTKAVGTGVIATASKADLASPESTEAMVRSMCALNKEASEVAVRAGVRACTDITGFGLAGHLVEMARASGCRIRIRARSVPILSGALEAASMGMVPAGAYGNRTFFASWITMDESVPTAIADLMFDPQTSGGLVLAIPPAQADAFVHALQAEVGESVAEIGEVLGTDSKGHLEIVS
jgi:selenide, water dikinase